MRQYEAVKRQRAKRIAEGKCIACCSPMTTPGIRCGTCNEKHSALMRAFRERLVGRCTKCYRPLPEHRAGMVTCGWCRTNEGGW